MLLRDQNLSEWPDLVAFALTHGYDIRFIEAMPLGTAGAEAVARHHVDTARCTPSRRKNTDCGRSRRPPTAARHGVSR
jgi:molybdenum cofactor biosynthesis enzyme MoaA